MAMDASTMTRNLQPLVTAGYFLNEQGLDLRSRLVSLTPAGQAKLAEADEAWEVAQQNMGAILGTERVANLNSLLGECITLLESSSS
jgi:DNA-binding MarR family transcriptional regulator